MIKQVWLPLIEGVRIIARHQAGSGSDKFDRMLWREAAGFLERAAREGRIRSKGVRYLDGEHTALTPEDWQRLSIYQDGRLDDPNRNLRTRPVRIKEVIVDAEDVHQTALSNSNEAQHHIGRSLATGEVDRAVPPEGVREAKQRRKTAQQAVLEEAFGQLYPDGVPSRAKLGDQRLHEALEKHLGKAKCPSQPTILRACGRRRR